MSRYKRKINDYMTLLSNETNSNEGEILIYGDIVSQAYDDGQISPTVVRDALDEMGAINVLNLHVNSYGGSVPDGNAIIAILDDYRRKNGTTINAYIEGIAASMGSGIPMVADKIYMASNALLMIHKPYTFVMGNVNDLTKEIEVLQKAEETLVKNYMRHFNGDEATLRDLMDKETWLTAEEAFDYGLCDEIVEGVAIAASAKGYFINNMEFTQLEQEAVAKLVPMAAVIPPVAQDKNNKGVDKVFEYDDNLNLYGIPKDKFEELNVSAETALIIAKMSADTTKPVDSVVFTIQQIVDTLGNKETAENILALAKAGMAFDEQANDKAKAYDKLVDSAIDEALKSGVRAKGEKFNEERWKKTLNSFSYNEILEQQAEWEEEAKSVLNAGKHISEPQENVDPQKDVLINPEDYNF